MKSEEAPSQIPPHDLDAEAAVISAVLVDGLAFAKVSDLLRPEHFYAEAHRRIFEACAELDASGKPIDVVTVSARLRDANRLEQTGGMTYLTEILNAAPAVSNVERYAEIVHNKYRVRQLIRAAQKITAEGYAGPSDATDFVQRAESTVYELARTTSTRSHGESMREVLGRAFKRIHEAYDRGPGELLGVPYGFAALDAQTGGMHPGEHTIVAARPGMGKTAFMLNVATRVARLQRDARQAFGVILFSLEMPSDQLAMRAMCSLGGVNVGRVRNNRFDDADWSKIAGAASTLAAPPHWYIEQRPMGLAEIRSIVRVRHAEMARDGVPLGLVAIDYLQIMQTPSDVDARNHEQAIASNARRCKELAKETGAHVMTLSQLNREVEKRNDKRPMLADLRESGAIEESGDCIIGIYRDEYYDRKSEAKGVAELAILKQRNGPTCTVDVGFDGPTTTFFDLRPDHESEAAQ